MIKNKIIKIFNKKLKISKKNLQGNLFENNVLDSFSFIEMISELEKEFKLKINLKKISIQNFQTFDQIIKFIKNNEKK